MTMQSGHHVFMSNIQELYTMLRGSDFNVSSAFPVHQCLYADVIEFPFL